MNCQRNLDARNTLVDEDALARLASQDFATYPPVPQRELLQFRALRARLARSAEGGLDIDCLQTEQFAGAAMICFQKSKVVASRCEYDMEVNDALMAHIGPNLRKDLAWYATNRTTSDPRVRSLPLGLNDYCNYSGFHLITGNTDYIAHIREMSRNSVRSRALLCFSDETTPANRTPVREILGGRDFIRDLPLEKSLNGYLRYLQALAQSQFCVCPRGAGIDTHRFWEALYLGCIPIILERDALGCHGGLPALVVKEWMELLDLDLVQLAQTMRSDFYDLRPLAISFWVRDAQLAAL